MVFIVFGVHGKGTGLCSVWKKFHRAFLYNVLKFVHCINFAKPVDIHCLKFRLRPYNVLFISLSLWRLLSYTLWSASLLFQVPLWRSVLWAASSPITWPVMLSFVPGKSIGSPPNIAHAMYIWLDWLRLFKLFKNKTTTKSFVDWNYCFLTESNSKSWTGYGWMGSNTIHQSSMIIIMTLTPLDARVTRGVDCPILWSVSTFVVFGTSLGIGG